VVPDNAGGEVFGRATVGIDARVDGMDAMGIGGGECRGGGGKNQDGTADEEVKWRSR
jgi:hypothetical protein